MPGYAPNGPFRGSHTSHYSQQHHTTRGGARQHTVARANNTWTAAQAASPSSSSSGAASNGSKHKKLVLNNPGKGKSVSPSTSDSVPLPPDVGVDSRVSQSQEASVAGVDTLAIAAEASREQPAASEQTKAAEAQEDEDMEEGEIDESTLPPPEPKKPPISLVKQGNEIIINGVTFVSDASGRKLVRKDSSSQLDGKGKGRALDSRDHSASMSTPSKTSIDGQAYVRTKSGNLISTAVLKKRQELAAKKKKINELVAVAKSVQKARQA